MYNFNQKRKIPVHRRSSAEQFRLLMPQLGELFSVVPAAAHGAVALLMSANAPAFADVSGRQVVAELRKASSAPEHLPKHRSKIQNLFHNDRRAVTLSFANSATAQVFLSV